VLYRECLALSSPCISESESKALIHLSVGEFVGIFALVACYARFWRWRVRLS
jgi:hypothetical protein